MNNFSIGKKIKKYIDSKGLKQSFVSEATGIPQPILSAMLNEKRNIYAHEYALICKVLGVSLDTFVPDEQVATKEAI
ncbi:Helix-turn-helix domain-containing protein [Natronincola peptidivorans]|uniref:Helix-turn-helix domain-containing protein n=1 Tax=Natronincola peptidivorans TaxID=426128 RepID=A0A1I0FE69_9FIRM|nr:helix-turn-helix transcriptional regulator [Natronincola peptidivorans]SET56479.1 Helix-turn-helix domain-containing protein [Natronincola peptidivorans]